MFFIGLRIESSFIGEGQTGRERVDVLLILSGSGENRIYRAGIKKFLRGDNNFAIIRWLC